MLADLQNPQQKSRTSVRYFKGTVDGADFTATVFHIERKEGKWRLSGTKVDENGTHYKLQLVLPDTYVKGVYKLEDHRDIVLTYSTTDLHDPILKYGDSGLVDFTTIDPASNHAAGALKDIVTRDNGDPVSAIEALFNIG